MGVAQILCVACFLFLAWSAPPSTAVMHNHNLQDFLLQKGIEIGTKALTELWTQVKDRISWHDFVFPKVPGEAAEATVHDIVVDINSVAAVLSGMPWSVIFNEGQDTFTSKYGNKLAARLCLKGDYNTGKTFAIGLMNGVPLPNGFTTHTSGLSIKFKAGTDGDDFLLIDSAGSNIPVENDAQMLDRRLTDAIIQEIAFVVCDKDVFVVNQLTLSDQIYLAALQQRLQRDHLHVKERLSILHNFKDIEKVEDMAKVIEKDIVKAFSARPADNDATHYISDHYLHFILGRENTEAGKKYNHRTISRLFTYLQGGTVNKKNVSSLLSDIMFHANDLLVNKYLVNGPREDTSAPSPSADTRPQDGWKDTLWRITETITFGIVGAAQPQQSNKRIAINDKIDYSLTLVRCEINAKPELCLVSEKPLDPSIRISPFLQFRDDGFVDFRSNGLFSPPIAMGVRRDGKVEITMDTPGVEKVHWATQGDLIRLRGCRRIENEFEHILRNERVPGCFEKTYKVADYFFDPGTVEVSEVNGVFKLVASRQEGFSRIGFNDLQ